MASTIAGTARIANAGAWASQYGGATASALYKVIQDTSSGVLKVMRSTDGATWTEQDAAHHVTNFSATHSFCEKLKSDGYIYIGYFSASITARLRRFNTATDLWETSDIGGDINVGVTNSSNIRVEVLSDGKIIFAFKGTGGSAAYSRFTSVSWPAAVAINSGSLICDVVVEAGDLTRFIFSDTTNNDFSYRSLSSANVLGTLTDYDTTAHTTARVLGSQAVLYDNGSVIRLDVLKIDSSGEIDKHGGDAGTDVLANAATNNAISTSTTINPTSLGLCAEGGKVQAVWSEANAVMRDQSTSLTNMTFGADTTVVSGLTDADPCPQWIVGGGGYGIIYQDNGSVLVEWIVSPSFPGGGGGFAHSSVVIVA